jgi:hypothetical protein
MYKACAKSRNGDFEGFDEIAVAPENGPYRHSYLCRCPQCGALWMGNGLQPQLMVELAPDEAKECFLNYE